MKSITEDIKKTVDNGKKQLSEIKLNVLSSVKECVNQFKQHGKQVVIKTTTPASIPNPIARLRNRETPPVNLPAPLSTATSRPKAINKTAAKPKPITMLTATFDRKSFFFEKP